MGFKRITDKDGNNPLQSMALRNGDVLKVDMIYDSGEDKSTITDVHFAKIGPRITPPEGE